MIILSIIATTPTVDDFSGIWTYNLTVNVSESGEQKDLEIYVECSKNSETTLQCIAAGYIESPPYNYTIFSDGTILYDDDPIYQGTLLESGILLWYENGTIVEPWKKRGDI